MSIEDLLLDEGLNRLSRYTTRDREFEAQMGKWARPEHLPRYPLERFKSMIRWHPGNAQIIDVAPLMKQLQPHDRLLAKEIAKFVAEEFQGKPASDVVLHEFACQFLRRLDACGF